MYPASIQFSNDSFGIHVQAGFQTYASHCVNVRLFPTCILLV